MASQSSARADADHFALAATTRFKWKVSDLAGLSSSLLILVGLAVLVGVTYFLAARLSLALISRPDGVAVFWPAAGVSSGLLIALGRAARWPVIVGTMAATVIANLLGDRNIWSAVVFAGCNAGEAVIVALLVERFFASPFRLDSVSRVFGLVMAAMVAASLSGAVATLGYVLFHTSTASVFTIWSHWFAADAMGVITVAPLLIGLLAMARDPPPREEVFEGLFAVIILVGLTGLIFHLPSEAWAVEVTIALFFPLILWVAARCHPTFAAATAFIFALAVVWTTTFEIGVFANSALPTAGRVLTAQASILATSMIALVFGALFAERRGHEAIVTESEAQLQGALCVGGVIAFDWELRTGQTRRSQNATQILGHDPEQPLLVASFLERIHPDDLDGFKACIRGACPEHPSYVTRFRYLRPDGQQMWLEETGQAEFDAAGRVIRVRGLTRDVTERKRAEAELAASREVAELADRAKSGFLAAASHDIRQPLQTLTLLAEAVKPHLKNSDGHAVVSRIERGLEVMKDVLDSLLDINRLETGVLRPTKIDFPIDELLDSLQAEFLRSVTERGLEWRLVQSGMMVHSDRRMLELMLRNLLSNAMRYTDQGRILLGCRRSESTLSIQVWDSGIGIAQENIAEIFNEYYQVEGRVHPGSFGLGLAIVQRLGNLLGHPVDVWSTPGKGSRFSIQVPLARKSAVQRTRPPVSSSDDRELAGTVLVIEDDSFVRSGLDELLGSYGMNVRSVANADLALKLVTSDGVSPDIILSDFNLPGPMTGVHCIEAIRQRLGRTIPAIVLTADIRSEVLSGIAKHDVLIAIKPMKVDQLLQLIGDARGHALPRVEAPVPSHQGIIAG